MSFGRGAGDKPTASSVVGDIIASQEIMTGTIRG